MSSIRKIDDKYIVFVKGSPQAILANSTKIYDGKIIRDITEQDKANMEIEIEKYAQLAMRNIGFAYKETSAYNEKTTMNETES
jgi:magnesium-transporting ATPase (P-type)